MPEEEMVRRILNACNPQLASGLRGIVSTVDQLVKTGSMIEKDWASSKGYWRRVQNVSSGERQVKKPPKKSGGKHFCELDRHGRLRNNTSSTWMQSLPNCIKLN
ncbi:hypothetical protein MHYP_G00260520 [Metynnis hypsauchen]